MSEAKDNVEKCSCDPAERPPECQKHHGYWMCWHYWHEAAIRDLRERLAQALDEIDECRIDIRTLAENKATAERQRDEAVEMLRKLHHAVCGSTGFAAAVRITSGIAYPWPALDEADAAVRAFLSTLEPKP